MNCSLNDDEKAPPKKEERVSFPFALEGTKAPQGYRVTRRHDAVSSSEIQPLKTWACSPDSRRPCVTVCAHKIARLARERDGETAGRVMDDIVCHMHVCVTAFSLSTALFHHHLARAKLGQQ